MQQPPKDGAGGGSDGAGVDIDSTCTDPHNIGVDADGASQPTFFSCTSFAEKVTRLPALLHVVVPVGAGADPDKAGADPDEAGADPDGAGPDPDGAGPDPDGAGTGTDAEVAVVDPDGARATPAI